MSFAATSSSNQLRHQWTKQLKTKQLQQILRSNPAAAEELRGCVERSDLDDLVHKHVGSLEEAHDILGTVTGTMDTRPAPDSDRATSGRDDLSKTKAVLMQLKQVLCEDRGVLNFPWYTPSTEHLVRMKKFAEIKPKVFDNPKITRREKWFTNPEFLKSAPHMPHYHVHFRQELQEAARSLYEAYATATASQQRRAILKAHGYLQSCLSGLHGHVGIEEYRVFPQMQRQHPEIDLDFLFRDHERLDDTEKKVTQEMKRLMMNSSGDSFAVLIPRDDIIGVLHSLLNFDAMLMTHLGEEEEVVVPISLAS